MSRNVSDPPSTSSGRPVWDAFERGSPAGRALFKLYDGDCAGKKIGNRISQKNSDAHRRMLAEGKLVPKKVDPSKWGRREVQHVEPKVSYPIVYGAPAEVDRFENPGRPGYGGGKRKEDIIKITNKILDLEIQAQPIPEPSRPLIGEVEKNRYARHLEFNGAAPADITIESIKEKNAKKQPRKPLTRLEELEKLFDDITTEIEDRHKFLADMEAMGMKEKYEKQTMQEVSQRITQLQKLDTEIKKCHKIVGPKVSFAPPPAPVDEEQ